MISTEETFSKATTTTLIFDLLLHRLALTSYASTTGVTANVSIPSRLCRYLQFESSPLVTFNLTISPSQPLVPILYPALVPTNLSFTIPGPQSTPRMASSAVSPPITSPTASTQVRSSKPPMELPPSQLLNGTLPSG